MNIVKSIYDCESDYKEYVKQTSDVCLDLSKWLPQFRQIVRPLVPGELMVVMSDTGVGKTAILQNIAYHADVESVLLFELELPNTLCFERFAALSNELEQGEIERRYINDEGVLLKGS